MIKDGRILLSVHCDNSEWTNRARDLLEKTTRRTFPRVVKPGLTISVSEKPRVRHGGSGAGL
jgi:hypothetical protein